MLPIQTSEQSRWRIGISQREQPRIEGREPGDALDSGYAAWLMHVLPNALVIPVPNFDQPKQALNFAQALQINALLFSGGGDLHVQPRRLATEHALLNVAREHRWPVLGICRGMQVLHHLHGGAVVPVTGHVGAAHPLIFPAEMSLIKPASIARLRDGAVMKPEAVVNSWHHFGIEMTAPAWRPLAYSAEGYVEAMRHTELPWLGLMWHPERESGGNSFCRPWLVKLFT